MSKTYKTIIVGAGLSGLTLANELVSKGHPKEDLLVLESDDRPGGLIKTTVEQGYITEWGPEGLRGGKPGTKNVFSLISANPMEIPSTIPARYIVKKGKLRRVPHGLFSAAFTPLVPFFGKIRILLEPFVRKKEGDETMEQFIKRRFGKGIYPIVDAVVSGTYGGTPPKLSVAHAFPYLKQAEQLGGSVTIGGIKMLRKARKAKPKTDKPKVKAPFLVKPEGGMTSIVDELAENVNIEFQFPVEKVSKDNGEYILYSGDKTYRSEKVVIASGVNTLGKISIPGMDLLEPVDESLVSIVSLGFKKEGFPDKFPGYGFLAPSDESRFVLGVLFTSQLFPNTAPSDEVLLRVYVGGLNHPERATMDDAQLIAHVLEDVGELMGLEQEPSYSSVQKHAPRGIAQIMPGHERILKWKEEAESKNDNLYLTGIGWNSIACEALINETVALASDLQGN